MAARVGVEPTHHGSKPCILPLDYRALKTRQLFRQVDESWQRKWQRKNCWFCLKHPGAPCEIRTRHSCLEGTHVIHWTPMAHKPLLNVAEHALPVVRIVKRRGQVYLMRVRICTLHDIRFFALHLY